MKRFHRVCIAAAVTAVLVCVIAIGLKPNIVKYIQEFRAEIKAQVASSDALDPDFVSEIQGAPKYVLPTLPDPAARPFYPLDGPTLLARLTSDTITDQLAKVRSNAALTGTSELDRNRRVTSQIVLQHIDGSYPWPSADAITSYGQEYGYWRNLNCALVNICLILDHEIDVGLQAAKSLAQIAIEQQETLDYLENQIASDTTIWGRNGYASTMNLMIGLTCLGVHPDAESWIVDAFAKITNERGIDSQTNVMACNLPSMDYYYPSGGHHEGNGYWASMPGEMVSYDMWKQATGQDLRSMSTNFVGNTNTVVYLRSEGRNLPISRYWSSQQTDQPNECRSWACTQNLIETDPVMSANLVKHYYDSGQLGDFGRYDPAFYFALGGSAIPLDDQVQPSLDEFHYFEHGLLAYRNARWAGASGQDIHAGQRCALTGMFCLMHGQDILISGSRTESVRHSYWDRQLEIAGWPFSSAYMLDSEMFFTKRIDIFKKTQPTNYTNAGLKLVPTNQAMPGESTWNPTTKIHTMVEYQMDYTRTVDYSDPTKIVITDACNSQDSEHVFYVQFCAERLPVFDGIGWIFETNAATEVENKTVRLVTDADWSEAREGYGKPTYPNQYDTLANIGDYIWPRQPGSIRGGWWQLNLKDSSGTITTTIELN